MDFTFDLSEESCPICGDKKFKNIIDDLLLKNISPEAIVRHLLDKYGTRFSANDVKIHKENHFKVKEQNAFRFADKQEEMRQIFERYKTGQQKTINLIETLNMMMEQMIHRVEEIMSDPHRNPAMDKNIVNYMKEMRQSATALAELKGDLSNDTNVNVHVIRNEAEPIIDAISSVIDEFSPELRDKFFLRLNEKLSEATQDESASED